MSPASATGSPSSENATQPAFASSEQGARFLPLRSIDTAPIGRTRAAPAARAFSRMQRVVSAESFAGFVLGMQQIEV